MSDWPNLTTKYITLLDSVKKWTLSLMMLIRQSLKMKMAVNLAKIASKSNLGHSCSSMDEK